MSLLKSVAAPLALVGTVCAVLASAPSAEAYEYRSGTILGYQAEVVDSGTYTDPDLISIRGPHGTEEIILTCSPFEWFSSGRNSQQFVESVAREWCF